MVTKPQHPINKVNDSFISSFQRKQKKMHKIKAKEDGFIIQMFGTFT